LPVGVAIGTNRRIAAWLQPLVQIAASLPATALFPVLLIFLLRLPGGLDLGAVVLLLMGTQWYLLFNIIAGASAVAVGTANFTDPTTALRVIAGIEEYLRRHKIARVGDLVGTIEL
jgi:NitT/TauT family transport system permease protein